MLDQKLSKYYRALGFPAKISRISRYLYICLFFFVIAFYLIRCIVVHTTSYKISIILMFHVIVGFSLPLFSKLLVRYMKIRQCINMSLFLLVPGIPLELLGAFIDIPGLMYIVIPIIGLISIRGFVYSRTKSMAIVLYTLIIEVIGGIFIDELRLNDILIRFTLTAIPMIMSIYFTEAVSYRESVDIYKITSSWIKSMLLNDEEEFSTIMSSIGLEELIDTHVLLFDLGSNSVALIVPEIHFGPFRNIGSAALPHIVDKSLSKVGITSFVLHSAGSHERNLVSIDESLNYTDEILTKIITKEGFDEDAIYEPFRVYNKYFEAFVIQTNNTQYIIISAPTIGNDDIPYNVQLKAVELGKIYGYKDVAIVDAHNVEGVPIKDIDKYMPIVTAALSKSSRPCIDFGIGYNEVAVKGYVNGLCSDKVKVLTIKCDESFYGLVYLYGNNAKPGVREILRRIARDVGYSDVEIVTADDHSCSGITFDVPYYAVELSSNLTRAVESALITSKNNVKKCKIYSAKLVTRNKIVGPNIFNLLELAKDVGQKVVRYMLAAYLLIYILAVVIVLFNLVTKLHY